MNKEEFWLAVRAAQKEQGRADPIIKVVFVNKNTLVVKLIPHSEEMITLSDPFIEEDRWLFSLNEIVSAQGVMTISEELINIAFFQRGVYQSIWNFGSELRDYSL